MQLTQILAQMGGLQAMARELGVNEQQAASGAEALLPALLGGCSKQSKLPGVHCSPSSWRPRGGWLGVLLGVSELSAATLGTQAGCGVSKQSRRQC